MFKAKSIELKLPATDVPEVEHVEYDLWLLRVTLRFNSERAPFYLHFASTSGFRVLDEGDLPEFWNPQSRPPGVVWEIESGGWLELERTRQGFISSQLPLREFLVVGINECVNVIGISSPECFSAKP